MKALLFAFVLLLIAYLAWPYTAVYKLDKALKYDDDVEIEQLIDLASIQMQIKNKMNKELESSIGDVSNGFIDWLQSGIQRFGSDAIESMVDRDWVKAQLRSHSANQYRGGFRKELSYAFFDGPDSFLLRIGELGDNPVHVQLGLQELHWRVIAIYN